MDIFLLFLNLVLAVKYVTAKYYFHEINYLNNIRNRTRPGKSFSSFSNNYFSQNSILRPSEKIECGTRTINFNPRRMARIVGGSETPYGAFPWQVEIQKLQPDQLTFEHHCGGAVVGERLVVSAAHCFDDEPIQLDHLRVVTGKHRLKMHDRHENRFLAENVIVHPEFRKNGPHSNDIALVVVRGRSTKSIQFNSHVRPICLPEAGTDDPGQWCAVSGWGLQEESTEAFSPVLRAAAVPLVDLNTCRKNQVLGGRQQPILDSMLCAGVLGGGVDACRGDSGGPLACMRSDRWEIRGVVSWGTGCARRARPGVYTRVTTYVPWIRSIARSLKLKLPG